MLKNRKPVGIPSGAACQSRPGLSQDSSEDATPEAHAAEEVIQPGTYWLTRVVLLRAVCSVYFVAFLVALNQNEALLGERGLTPFRQSIDQGLRPDGSFSARWQKFLHRPTLLWFMEPSDDNMKAIAITGLLLSSAVVLLGAATAWMMGILWILYQSIVNVGGLWYGFGWESQLLETGFLAIWMCPCCTLRRFPRHAPTPLIVIWAYRWLIFRIMLGAGLIKIRGDLCWRDLTCMNYHYETQPVPGPLSREFHLAPTWWHITETLGNHFVELVAPWLLFCPRVYRIWGGIVQILFQLVLISSGNLSFLNWLTIVPSLSCFDDLSLRWLFNNATLKSAAEAQSSWSQSRPGFGVAARWLLELCLACLLAYLSWPVVLNLASTAQAMNTSFDAFRIVNTYGAFGSITKVRTEVVLEGTNNSDPHGSDAVWQEFNFKCKPGDVHRRPCLVTPYHYRLDWLMWFAAFSSYQHHPWILKLATKLMQGDEAVYGLLAQGPFSATDPPKAIRAAHYTYKFAPRGSKEAEAGQWFIRRRRREEYFPIITLSHPVIVRDFLDG